MSNPSQPRLRDRRHNDGGSRKPQEAPRTRRHGRRGVKLGAFVREALHLFDAGLIPVPASPEDIKKPGVAHSHWSRDPGRRAIEAWMASARHAGAEVGLLTGRGTFPVTVVDIDDVSEVEAITALLGPTPLVVATPSGGRHLYYRFSGERCANLRRLGWAADVKAAGGYVVAPPSKRPRSPGRRSGGYRLLRGSWADVARLPALPADWLERLSQKGAQRRDPQGAKPPQACHSGKHGPGVRNAEVFSAALRHAPMAESLADLQSTMEDWNALNCEPDLEGAEVAKTAASAWKYEEEGKNFVGVGGVSLRQDELRDIGDADALFVWAHLRLFHGANDQAFALVVPRMVDEGSVPGFGAHRLRKAISRLMHAGYLTRVHQGGRWKGDPSLYRLAYPRRVAAV
jgi:hypothetical protein